MNGTNTGFRSSAPATSTGTSSIDLEYGRGTLAGTPVYHVIVGSFPSRDAALRSQGARQSQGFNAYIIDPDVSSTKYRLGVYRSANRREVDAYRQQLVRSGKASSSWIYEQKALVVPTSSSTASGNRVVGGVYHLIGGSYQNFEDADTYKRDMQSRGYNAVIMFPKPGVSTTYRVSIVRSAAKSEVKKGQQKYKAQTRKDAWIYFER